MTAEKQVAPFMLHHHENNSSVTLNVGDYKAKIFAERADEGFEGSGYDWASLAAVFLVEKMPALEADIRFDPEGRMFCAYSKRKEALEKFAVAFHAMCVKTKRRCASFSQGRNWTDPYGRAIMENLQIQSAS